MTTSSEAKERGKKVKCCVRQDYCTHHAHGTPTPQPPPPSPPPTTPPVQTDGTRHLSRWSQSRPTDATHQFFHFFHPAALPPIRCSILAARGGGGVTTPECKEPQRNVWGIRVINASPLPPRRDCLFLCQSSGLVCWFWLVCLLITVCILDAFVNDILSKPSFCFFICGQNRIICLFIFVFDFSFANTAADLISTEGD